MLAVLLFAARVWLSETAAAAAAASVATVQPPPSNPRRQPAGLARAPTPAGLPRSLPVLPIEVWYQMLLMLPRHEIDGP